jgi:single-strand DNA-binding protein
MINRIILMGRLTADPEYRQTPNGIAVATFSIAVDRRYASQGQERQADFIPCVAWRQHADFISRYFFKGNMIAVEGSLQTRKYTDKQGNNRTAYEVVIDQASFCGSKSESGNGGNFSGNAPARTAPHQNSAPAPSKSNFAEPPQGGKAFEIGDFGDFEELDNDDGLPF